MHHRTGTENRHGRRPPPGMFQHQTAAELIDAPPSPSLTPPARRRPPSSSNWMTAPTHGLQQHQVDKSASPPPAAPNTAAPTFSADAESRSAPPCCDWPWIACAVSCRAPLSTNAAISKRPEPRLNQGRPMNISRAQLKSPCSAPAWPHLALPLTWAPFGFSPLPTSLPTRGKNRRAPTPDAPRDQLPLRLVPPGARRVLLSAIGGVGMWSVVVAPAPPSPGRVSTHQTTAPPSPSPSA